MGNGPNLTLTPPEQFDYPTFGMNTCHLWQGEWIPTYYTAVDQRVMREFGDAICEKFTDVPKFVPRPNLNQWKGENFYRFLHSPGGLMREHYSAADETALWRDGIGYYNVMHVAIQLAMHMGFAKCLMIGVQHRPHKAQLHFWGTDHGMVSMHFPEWLEGYQYLTDKIELINISPDTWVPEDVLPRDDWRKYAREEAQEETQAAIR